MSGIDQVKSMVIRAKSPPFFCHISSESLELSLINNFCFFNYHTDYDEHSIEQDMKFSKKYHDSRDIENPIQRQLQG